MPLSPELKVIAKIEALLAPLSAEACSRVLRYCGERIVEDASQLRLLPPDDGKIVAEHAGRPMPS